jgi:hypothetical protein
LGAATCHAHRSRASINASASTNRRRSKRSRSVTRRASCCAETPSNRRDRRGTRLTRRIQESVGQHCPSEWRPHPTAGRGVEAIDTVRPWDTTHPPTNVRPGSSDRLKNIRKRQSLGQGHRANEQFEPADQQQSSSRLRSDRCRSWPQLQHIARPPIRRVRLGAVRDPVTRTSTMSVPDIAVGAFEPPLRIVALETGWWKRVAIDGWNVVHDKNLKCKRYLNIGFAAVFAASGR